MSRRQKDTWNRVEAAGHSTRSHPFQEKFSVFISWSSIYTSGGFVTITKCTDFIRTPKLLTECGNKNPLVGTCLANRCWWPQNIILEAMLNGTSRRGKQRLETMPQVIYLQWQWLFVKIFNSKHLNQHFCRPNHII